MVGSIDKFIIASPTTGHPSLRTQQIELKKPGAKRGIKGLLAGGPRARSLASLDSIVSRANVHFLMKLPDSLAAKVATYTRKCYTSIDIIVESCNGKEITYSHGPDNIISL